MREEPVNNDDATRQGRQRMSIRDADMAKLYQTPPAVMQQPMAIQHMAVMQPRIISSV